MNFTYFGNNESMNQSIFIFVLDLRLSINNEYSELD
jgi:hypothetical protein